MAEGEARVGAQSGALSQPLTAALAMERGYHINWVAEDAASAGCTGAGKQRQVLLTVLRFHTDGCRLCFRRLGLQPVGAVLLGPSSIAVHRRDD